MDSSPAEFQHNMDSSPAEFQHNVDSYDDSDVQNDLAGHEVEDLRPDIKEVFDIYDKNHDGSIDINELADGMRALGGNPTDAEIQAMMKEADSKVNPSGRIEFNEFYDLMVAHVKSREEEEESLREAFRCFDRNGDARIDKKELREALTSVGLSQLTDEEVEELFAQADKDNNDYIDYKELVAVLTNSSK